MGSCSSVSVPTTGGKKTVQDATRPSPCDVAAFVPITPCRGNGHGSADVVQQDDRVPGTVVGRGGDVAPMSPVSRAGGGIDAPVPTGKAGDGGGGRGRFATDFEVKEVIGTGSFGTVYKVCGFFFFHLARLVQQYVCLHLFFVPCEESVPSLRSRIVANTKRHFFLRACGRCGAAWTAACTR